ncbi:MAG: flavin reductase family protein [Clostridia bacterium]|nr:flavin reductase family protein [Clostridia bacterium]
MAKVQLKGSVMMGPLPAVMASVGTMESSNVITIAWTGVLCSNPPRVYISVRPERHSYQILHDTKQFVINLASKPLTAAVDYCGFKSGRDVDKFAEMGFTKQPAAFVDCPMIAESPINLECKVFDVVNLGSHDVFMADVVAVHVDESIMVDGKVDFAKAGLINYQHGEYYANGKHLGRFGFSIQRKYIKANGKGVAAKIDNAKFTKRNPTKHK